MTDKIFLIKMVSNHSCDFCRVNKEYQLECVKIRDLCAGNLNCRPKWCPLVEHDISICHDEFNAIGDNLAYEATKKMGW